MPDAAKFRITLVFNTISTNAIAVMVITLLEFQFVIGIAATIAPALAILISLAVTGIVSGDRLFIRAPIVKIAGITHHNSVQPIPNRPQPMPNRDVPGLP